MIGCILYTLMFYRLGRHGYSTVGSYSIYLPLLDGSCSLKRDSESQEHAGEFPHRLKNI